jgi:hypothetical protein
VKRKIYQRPIDTARHEQLKQICLDYFTHFEKLMKHPSMLNASRARKACVRMKRVAHARGIELLELYAPSRNGEKWPPYGKQKQQQQERHDG